MRQAGAFVPFLGSNFSSCDACASSSSSVAVALMGEISRFRVDVDAASRHTTTEGERGRGRHHNSSLLPSLASRKRKGELRRDVAGSHVSHFSIFLASDLEAILIKRTKIKERVV